jgi:hypothetical protein
MAATACAVLLALRNSGDDPIPSYLIGQIIGTTLVIVLPIAMAIAAESSRRIKREA